VALPVSPRSKLCWRSFSERKLARMLILMRLLLLVLPFRVVFSLVRLRPLVSFSWTSTH